MNQANSNSKFKQNLVRIIIAILLTITALNWFKPITTYADSTNTKGYNGTGATEGGYVGKLFWGGSTTRTALVFYIVNGQTGKVLTAGDILGPNCNNPTDRVAFLVYNSSDEEYFDTDFIHDANLYTHFGAMKRDANVAIYDNSMPYPVQYNEDTHAWSSNNDAVATWLFSKVGDYEMWQYIIKEGFTNKYRNDLLGDVISEALFKSMESGTVFDSIFGTPIQLEEGEDAFVLCIEPVSTHCVYGTAQWTEDSAQEFINRATEVDSDCVNYLNKYKEQHGTYAGAYRPAADPTKNRIIRACATGSSAAKGNNNIAAMMGLNPNNSSNANKKWVHQALPYCMVLAYDQLGLSAITSSTPEFKTAEEYERGDMGYGISMFGKELQADFISTYDGYSREPAPSEQPVDTPDKNTTGDCTITKIYFDIEIDGLTGGRTYTFVDAFLTKNTTGRINLTPEKGKSGYSIKKWATTIEPFSNIESYYRSDKYGDLLKRFENATYWGTGTGGVQQFQLNNEYYGDRGKRKHLYVVYTKTTLIPAPEIKEYDFEIPESYITKQVYFSDANNTSNTENTALSFTKNKFKWTSEAHNNCPGHEVLDCRKPEHKHTTTVYSAGILDSPYRCLFFTHF